MKSLEQRQREMRERMEHPERALSAAVIEARSMRLRCSVCEGVRVHRLVRPPQVYSCNDCETERSK